MLLIILAFVHLITTSHTLDVKPLQESQPEPIAPYAFGYVANGHDGRSSREEVSDGSGTVKGYYEILGADGIQRLVKYIADANGFRASVLTNEPGTETRHPANVLFESSQPTAEELSLKHEENNKQFKKHDIDFKKHDFDFKKSDVEFKKQDIGQHPFDGFSSSHKSAIIDHHTIFKPTLNQRPSFSYSFRPPVVQQPSVQQPFVQQPFVQQPFVQQPFAQQPFVEQPSVQQPSVQQPFVQQPFVHQAPTKTQTSHQTRLAHLPDSLKGHHFVKGNHLPRVLFTTTTLQPLILSSTTQRFEEQHLEHHDRFEQTKH